jgi:hypothetical protein
MELRLIFPDGARDNSLWVTPLGDNLYRAEESTMSMGTSEQVIRYGDVFEVELTSELEFQRMVQPSPYETSTRLVPQEWVSISRFDEFSQRLLSLGGYWRSCLAEFSSSISRPERSLIWSRKCCG